MRLALSIGRLDFWNLPDELTAYQLTALQAAYEIDPWGEQRDDMRIAWNTMMNIASQAAKRPDEAAMAQFFHALQQFTKKQQRDAEEHVDDFSAVQAMFGG